MKQVNYHIYRILIFLITPVLIQAQTVDTVSFNDLLIVAIDKNHGILITKNDVEISSLNNSYGNAGFLPVVGASVVNNYSISDNKSVLSDGTENVNNGVRNNMIDALVQMNWTLFDGTKMFVTKNRLNELENRSSMQLQLEAESIYTRLASIYYALVQEQKLEQVLKYTLGISRFRFDLADKKFRLGAASEVDRIQASLDYSNDSSLLLKEETKIANLKADINNLIGRNPEILFSVDSVMEMLPELSYPEMVKLIDQQNKSLLLARNNVRIKELELQETRSNFLPSLSLYADYDYFHSGYTTGTIDYNQSIGPTVGLRLSYNIFNGFNDKRKIEIGKIEYQSAQLEEEMEINSVKSDLYQNYNTYSSAIKQMKLETENLVNARKNLQFAVELYRRGAINEIDFREIQRKEFDAENRLLFAQYFAKIAEIQLLQISGNLRF